MNLVGIDLGGTKIEGVIIDRERPTQPLARVRVPTEATGGYDHILGQIGLVIDKLRAEAPEGFPSAVGIGTPGTLDPKTQTLRGSNTQCLNGMPVKADLEERFDHCFEVENDANCFALAEATMGAARGYETVFGVILGTGVGGGFVVHGRCLHGAHGCAGEWGQIVIEPHGELSVYGTSGIIEAYISGPALEKFYERETGSRRALKEIAATTASDRAAAATIDRLTSYFVRAIAIIVDSFDPHAIVVGGGVGNIDVLYSQEVRDRISEAIFAPSFEVPLLKPELGDSAGVFGAAMLAR